MELMTLRRKIAIEIEEDVHMKMKQIALEEKRYVYEIYEEIAREYIKKTENQQTLDVNIENPEK